MEETPYKSESKTDSKITLNPTDKKECKTSPHCSHNTNGRSMDKPCSVEFEPKEPKCPYCGEFPHHKKCAFSGKPEAGDSDFNPKEPSCWEKKFDKEFPLGFFDGDDNLAEKMKNDIKDFIRTLLEEAEERGYKKGVKETMDSCRKTIELIIKGKLN